MRYRSLASVINRRHGNLVGEISRELAKMEEQTAKRSWATMEFEVSADHEEMACWLMIHNGASGCEVSPLENEKVTIKATFPEAKIEDLQLQKLQSAMEEYGLSSSLRTVKVSAVEEQDWLERWKEGFRPFTVGKKLGICPPWLKDQLDGELMKGRHVIYIEPGMAFGTGLHATTQYCMNAIEREVRIGDALDVGTGSGILAIAAAFLNPASRITAIDIDPESIRTAKLNCDLNGVLDRVDLTLGTTTAIHNHQFKHIFSNMTCEDIIALLPEYERLLLPGGVVFCAGVLTEKLHLLDAAMTTRRWKVVQKEESGMWTGLTIGR